MTDTAIGPYLVLEKLGEGGMGEVYRARDTRLNRDVALKLLPPQLADDPERIARLRREAQALAALNHPNVAHVYALEESAGKLALVMELVGGRTIAELLAAQGSPPAALPAEQAIAIARQIAEGMEAAHEAGVIHRDLKPSNVKVRDDGTVKVLDFGLAKSADERLRSGDVAMSPILPTLTSPAMTSLGVIMGTAAYMSPEQAKGRPADRRADIWAFGCLLWEMLTGTALFARETMSETLAAVLKDAPPFEQLPPDVPLPVRVLLTRCLDRDPKQRLRDIGEARIVLSAPLDRIHDQPARVRPNRLWPVIAAVAVALAVIVAAGAAWQLWKQTPLPVKRLDLPVEIGSRVFALSPDGQRIAYFSTGHFFVRAFDSLDPVDLGTAPPGAENLIWSPDGQTLAFTGAGTIQTVPASGGPTFTVCRIPASGRVMGMAWVPTTSSIAFAVWRDSLYTVPASGGAPSVLVPINPQTEVDFHTVNALPDGRLIVDTHERASDSVAVEIIDGRHRTTLSSDPKLLGVTISGDRAVFLRTDVNPGLWTAPVTRDAIDLPHATLIQPNAIAYDTSLNGSAVVQLPAVSMHELESVDVRGGMTALPGPPVEQPTSPVLAVSPDGRRAAYVAGAVVGNLFVRDLSTGRDTQLTFSRADDPTNSTWRYLRPSWLPTSDRLLHAMGGVADEKLVIRRADAAGDARTLTPGIYGVVSADGRTLVYTNDARGRHRAMRATFRPDGSIDTAQPLFSGDSEPDVSDLALSPDGRLLAYAAADENGRLNVYLTDFPAAQGRLLVEEGGSRPRFGRAGNELFYLKGDRDADGHTFGVLMSVRINTGPPVTLETPVRLFDDRSGGLELSTYAVGSGGQFVIARHLPPPPGKGERVVLIENWRSLVGR